MKINSINKNENTENGKNIPQKEEDENSKYHRSLRKIIPPKEDSFTSDLNSISDKIEEEEEELIKETNDEIIMEGNILFRYALNQIEIEGFWAMTNEITKEKFSYLFQNKSNFMKTQIDINEIHFDTERTVSNIQQSKIIQNEEYQNENENTYQKNHKISNPNYEDMNQMQISDQEYNRFISGNHFDLFICNANIFEVLLIPNEILFSKVLEYLSGEYHGFFIYLSKTIEDRFLLNFSLEDHQVKVTGEGSNNLGEFSIIGFANFYTIKEHLLAFNKIESDVIKFGMIKITRIYHAFDNNENSRVIKSYQHSRKKLDDDEI